jgi:hypothetical protein
MKRSPRADTGTNFPSDGHACPAHEGTQVIGPTVQNISIPVPSATDSSVFLNVSNMLTAVGIYGPEFLK